MTAGRPGAPTPRRLDELAVAATPAERTEHLGGWLVRVSPSLPFRRTNSVVPFPGPDPADRPLDARLARVTDRYRATGAPARIQVVPDADPADLDAALADRGWRIEAPVVVLWSPLPLAPPGSPDGHDTPADDTPADDAPIGVTVLAGGSGGAALEAGPAWHAALEAAGADPTTGRRFDAYGRMLAPLGSRAHLAVATVDGRPVGVGRSVTIDGWTALLGMATLPTHRRRGVATAVVRALTGRAAGEGGAGAWLQVEEDNLGARRLYERLGFRPSHRYHYRTDGSANAGA